MDRIFNLQPHASQVSKSQRTKWLVPTPPSLPALSPSPFLAVSGPSSRNSASRNLCNTSETFQSRHCSQESKDSQYSHLLGGSISGFVEFSAFRNLCYYRDYYTMADTNAVREENPELFPKEGKGWDDYEHQKNLKAGTERLDRRSNHPDKNAVKKHGHGGKFTVDGPYTDADYSEDIPAAMDERDPNFVDPADEQADKDAEIPVVEVAKVAATGAGVSHSAS